MVIFLFYYLWIIMSFLSFIFVKKYLRHYYTRKPLSFSGWAILLYFIGAFIPIINVFESITFFIVNCTENEIDPNLKNKINSNFIIKALNKEY